MVGVLQDITEQKQTLESLKESEERLRMAIDSAKLGTLDFKPLTGQFVWDDRCKEFFGLNSHDHADYEVFLKGIHPDGRQRTHESNQNALNGLAEGEYEY